MHDVFGSDLERACVCSACGFRSPSTHVEMMLMLNATLGLRDEDFLLSAESSMEKPWESRSDARGAQTGIGELAARAAAADDGRGIAEVVLLDRNHRRLRLRRMS